MIRSITSLAALLLFPLALAAQAPPPPNPARFQQQHRSPGGSSLSFIENRGQWPQQVRLAARINGLDLWISNSSILYDLHTIGDLHPPAASAPLAASRHTMRSVAHRRGHRISMEFLGASADAIAEGEEIMAGHYNYFIGNDPGRWASQVPHYRSTRLKGIYPGIDARLYFDGEFPRYDIILSPGADPGRIALRFDGAEQVWVTESGELAMRTSLGTVYQRKLLAYQMVNGRQRPVTCSFKTARDASVRFALGAYDARLPLVIDPLIYSTLLGGSGHDGANAIDQGIITGYSGNPGSLATGFPATPGAYDTTVSGDADIFVAAIDRDKNLLFSTVIGGAGVEEGLDVIGGLNGITVCGFTSSRDFPTTSGAFDTSYNGGSRDGFVLTIDSRGATLLSSTYLGGSGEDVIHGLLKESQQRIRICGSTSSENFPTAPGAYDSSFNGGIDMFSAIFSPTLDALVSSTYIGGTGDDIAYAISSETTGELRPSVRSLVVGTTTSSDFPTSANAYDRSYNGGVDIAMLRLSINNSGLGYSSYFGGSGDDYGHDIADGSPAEMILCGHTTSDDIPTTEGAYDRSYNGGSDALIARFIIGDPAPLFCTYLGGALDDEAYALLASSDGKLWIAGGTLSGDFPAPPAGYDTENIPGKRDGFISLIDGSGDSLPYSTYFGGDDDDVITDITFYNGLIFCGRTRSENFPTTADAFDRSPAESWEKPGTISYDAFMAELNPASITLITQTPGGNTLVCPSTSYDLTWAAFEVRNFTLDLIDASGRIHVSTTIDSSSAARRRWDWRVHSLQQPGDSFRLVLRSGTIADTGTRAFTILTAASIITEQPKSRSAAVGESVTFTVAASSPEATFQWRKNSVPIPDATTSSHTIAGVQQSDAGKYDVIVADRCTITSQAATLTVGSSGVAGESLRPLPVTMTVLPNPVATHATLMLSNPRAVRELSSPSLALYNTLGEQVLNLTEEMLHHDDGTIEFDTAPLPAGTYYFRLMGKGYISIIATVVIER